MTAMTKPSLLPFDGEIRHAASLVEQITKLLTDAIMEGKLRSGQPLVESELQRKLNVSRSPIRESLRILERSGFLVTLPRKGTFVRTIARKDIEENFSIRAILEGYAARLATRNTTPEDIQRMEVVFSKMKEAANVNDFRAYFQHHSAFHDVFIYGSKNDTLIDFLNNLRNRSIFFRITYLWHQPNYDYYIRIHRKIINLFLKKDADKTEALVREHTLVALDDFLRFIDSKTLQTEM